MPRFCSSSSSSVHMQGTGRETEESQSSEHTATVEPSPSSHHRESTHRVRAAPPPLIPIVKPPHQALTVDSRNSAPTGSQQSSPSPCRASSSCSHLEEPVEREGERGCWRSYLREAWVVRGDGSMLVRGGDGSLEMRGLTDELSEMDRRLNNSGMRCKY